MSVFWKDVWVAMIVSGLLLVRRLDCYQTIEVRIKSDGARGLNVDEMDESMISNYSSGKVNLYGKLFVPDFISIVKPNNVANATNGTIDTVNGKNLRDNSSVDILAPRMSNEVNYLNYSYVNETDKNIQIPLIVLIHESGKYNHKESLMYDDYNITMFEDLAIDLTDNGGYAVLTFDKRNCMNHVSQIENGIYLPACNDNKPQWCNEIEKNNNNNNSNNSLVNESCFNNNKTTLYDIISDVINGINLIVSNYSNDFIDSNWVIPIGYGEQGSIIASYICDYLNLKSLIYLMASAQSIDERLSYYIESKFVNQSVASKYILKNEKMFDLIKNGSIFGYENVNIYANYINENETNAQYWFDWLDMSSNHSRTKYFLNSNLKHFKSINSPFDTVCDIKSCYSSLIDFLIMVTSLNENLQIETSLIPLLTHEMINKNDYNNGIYKVSAKLSDDIIHWIDMITGYSYNDPSKNTTIILTQTEKIFEHNYAVNVLLYMALFVIIFGCAIWVYCYFAAKYCPNELIFDGFDGNENERHGGRHHGSHGSRRRHNHGSSRSGRSSRSSRSNRHRSGDVRQRRHSSGSSNVHRSSASGHRSSGHRSSAHRSSRRSSHRSSTHDYYHRQSSQSEPLPLAGDNSSQQEHNGQAQPQSRSITNLLRSFGRRNNNDNNNNNNNQNNQNDNNSNNNDSANSGQKSNNHSNNSNADNTSRAHFESIEMHGS